MKTRTENYFFTLIRSKLNYSHAYDFNSVRRYPLAQSLFSYYKKYDFICYT